MWLVGPLCDASAHRRLYLVQLFCSLFCDDEYNHSSKGRKLQHELIWIFTLSRANVHSINSELKI